MKVYDHILYACAIAVFAAVAIVAAWLDPDPSGLGTHTQLHLPPCGLWETFHKPCPSCGMTTSWALLMHARPLQALRAQPAGVAVFLAAFCWWLYLPIAWRKGRPFGHLFELKATLCTALFLIVIILGVWAWRLATA